MEEEKISENIPESVPYYVYESAIARSERRFSRVFWAWCVTILFLFASNLVWAFLWNQYDTISYEQDGEGLNNINTGEQGDVYGADTQSTAEKESESQGGKSP